MKKIYMTPATEVQFTASYSIMDGSPTEREVNSGTGGPGYDNEGDEDEDGRVKGRNDFYSLW